MRRGFTLIELLVVVAIIAILAAILFPVFAKAREKARQSQCHSNLNLIGRGLASYAADFDGAMPLLPIVTPGQEGTRTPAVWTMLCERGDAPNSISFACPSDRRWNSKQGCVGPNTAKATSYAIRDEAFGQLLLQSGNGNFPAVIEYSGNDGIWLVATIDIKNQGIYVNMADRHNDGLNILFLDGHVKWRIGATFVTELKEGDYHISLSGQPVEKPTVRKLIPQPDGTYIDPETKEVFSLPPR